jgi:hypothetical protein
VFGLWRRFFIRAAALSVGIVSKREEAAQILLERAKEEEEEERQL